MSLSRSQWGSVGERYIGWGTLRKIWPIHYSDVIMGVVASQITSLTIVYSTAYSDADQRKHQSSASLAFVRGIQRWPVNSSHKWPVTPVMFPFDDVIMNKEQWYIQISFCMHNDISLPVFECFCVKSFKPNLNLDTFIFTLNKMTGTKWPEFADIFICNLKFVVKINIPLEFY